MGRNFAHSEDAVNAQLRYCRSDVPVACCYDTAMRLRIRELREAQDIKQGELAKAAGISPSYLNEIENGKKQVNQRRLESIARALGVQVIDLIREGADADAVEKHLEAFRQLSPEDQAAVHRHAASLLAQKEAG